MFPLPCPQCANNTGPVRSDFISSLQQVPGRGPGVLRQRGSGTRLQTTQGVRKTGPCFKQLKLNKNGQKIKSKMTNAMESTFNCQAQGQKSKVNRKVKTRLWDRVCNGLAHHHPPTNKQLFLSWKLLIKVRQGSREGQMLVRWLGECQVKFRWSLKSPN